MSIKWFSVVAWLVATLLAASSVGADEASEAAAADALLEHAAEPWTGDLDGMVERGFVRVLTAHNPMFLHYDGARVYGIAVELSQAFEKWLKKTYGKKDRPLHVVLMPVARDQLLPGLIEGRGDIAAANLTITPARQELVQFSIPTYSEVGELVVTGPAAPDIASFDDLADTELHLRRSSSYFEHFSALNEERKKKGKPEIPVREADEHLEDYDLLEMVNANLIPAVIVDSHKAALWAQVFDNIRVHEDLAVHSGGSIAWALRKDSPKLLEAVNGFLETARKGTVLGNVLFKRYLKSTKWMDNALAAKERKKFQDTIGFIKRHADEYRFDWLMIAAQGYQESKLDQSKRSRAGAIGIMQLLPSTAADPNVGIPDIHKAERNVEAGVKYLRFIRERYFSDPEIAPLDQALFSFAAYNAGPGNIAKARTKAAVMNLDPNVWFDNVEVAAARTISREPVVYVRNIYKYYIAFKLAWEVREAREAAREGQK
jgi:membrane-bound lytic murein transglycosylase MltF